MTSPRRFMQKSMSMSGIDTRSGFRKRSKSSSFCSGSMSVISMHVGDERARRRAAARADGDVLLPRIADEVPDDHEIAGKLHLLDAVDLAVEPRLVLGDGLVQQAAFAQVRDGGVEPLLQAFAADLLEVAVERLALGDGELRERVVDLGQLQIAALEELHGAGADLGRMGERRDISSADLM